MNRLFTEWWHPFVGFSSVNNDTMTKASYYSLEVQSGLKILSYNTNYMWVNYMNIYFHNIIFMNPLNSFNPPTSSYLNC